MDPKALEAVPQSVTNSSEAIGPSYAFIRYKVKSAKSFVDPTLFKTVSPQIRLKCRDNTASWLGQQDPAKKRIESSNDAVTITRNALEEMLRPSPVLSFEEHQALKREKEKRLEQARKHAYERRKRMQQMDDERKKHHQQTETELLKKEQDKATTRRARHLMDEQLDDVKQMNQMMLYAQCVSIRDKQVDEKRQKQLQEMEEERRLDNLMEIDRQRAVKEAEEVEKKAVENRYKGARVIEQQLEERKRQRQREGEARQLESDLMLRRIEAVKKEDDEARLRRKEVADQMMQEVAKANHEQIRLKEEAKLQEKEDDKRILEYVKQRDAREQEELLMKERIAKEKELETARLRAQQEKMADKQAELDELRARRYQEAKEKEWRDKELAEKRRKEKTLAEIARARESQKAAKIQQLSEMARMEQQEFYRVLEVSKRRAIEEEEQEQAVKEASLRYKDELLKQVERNEATRTKERESALEESKKLRQERNTQMMKLEDIKERKIRELKGSGVPDKYITELSKKKIHHA